MRDGGYLLEPKGLLDCRSTRQKKKLLNRLNNRTVKKLITYVHDEFKFTYFLDHLVQVLTERSLTVDQSF